MSTFSSTHQPTRRSGGRSGTHSSYDLDALHRLLWLRSNSRHQLEFAVKELAEELDVNYQSTTRAVRKLVNRGDLKALGRSGPRTLFRVFEPVE